MPELEQISQLHFLRPAWLLLIIPMAALLILRSRSRDPGQQWKPVIAPHLLSHMLVRGNHTQWFSPTNVSLALVPVLLVALAGPSWTRAVTPFAEDKAPLIIAIDLSASMAEADLQPNRLQRARDKILQLIEDRGDAATALLAYAGTAHSVLPLSDDHELLLHFLDALQLGMLPRPGKSPQAVRPLAETYLKDAPGGATLLLVGDGASDASAEAFKDFSTNRQIQVLVWGMGKTQEQLDSDTQRGLDSGAQALQETQLRAIATAAGGYYRRVTADAQDIRDLRRRIQRHYASADDEARPWLDGGYRLLPLIMLMFLLWFRKGWVLQW